MYVTYQSDFIFYVGDTNDDGSDDRWGSPNRDGGEHEDDEDVDYYNGEGGGYHFGPQNSFQHQFGMWPPGGMTVSSRGRGTPSFMPNWSGFGVPPTLPPRPRTAPPGGQSEMVCLS